MKDLFPILGLALLMAGCTSPAKRWSELQRWTDLTPDQVTKAMGREPSVRQEWKRVYQIGSDKWYEGNVTIYRYQFGHKKGGKEEYAEFYFDGTRYLSDNTNLPMNLE